jgi:hypothetical protein
MITTTTTTKTAQLLYCCYTSKSKGRRQHDINCSFKTIHLETQLVAASGGGADPKPTQQAPPRPPPFAQHTAHLAYKLH